MPASAFRRPDYAGNVLDGSHLVDCSVLIRGRVTLFHFDVRGFTVDVDDCVAGFWGL